MTRQGQIFLIGFMGVGKTTVSHALSDLTGAREIDLDEAVERGEGMSVSAIFERYGEPYFRDLESAALRQAAAGPPAIVSCGGGCVLREENVSVMKESGTTVLLTAEPRTVFERLKCETDRPILNGHMDAAYIADLMEKRRPAYDAACDIRVATDDKTPPQIAQEIRAALG